MTIPIAEIRARLAERKWLKAAASSPPWTWDEASGTLYSRPGDAPAGYVVVAFPGDDGFDVSDADKALIAHMRNVDIEADMAVLLDALDKERWVSVEERLPTEPCCCIVSHDCTSTGDPVASEAWFQVADRAWKDTDDRGNPRDITQFVTHWRKWPLPVRRVVSTAAKMQIGKQYKLNTITGARVSPIAVEYSGPNKITKGKKRFPVVHKRGDLDFQSQFGIDWTDEVELLPDRITEKRCPCCNSTDLETIAHDHPNRVWRQYNAMCDCGWMGNLITP